MNADQYRILLVEDNRGDSYLLRKALEAAEVAADLTIIEDGAEALAFVRREGKYSSEPVPDLAVLDMNLPKNDGLEILSALRLSALSSVPVVIITSSPSPKEREKLEEFKISRYIVKPPDLDDFLRIGNVLKQVLRDRGTERS